MREQSKIALGIFATFFVALVVGILLSLKILLWPVLLGFLLAYILDPVVDYFEAKHMNRTAAIAVLFGGLFLVLGLLVLIFVVPLFEQVQRIIDDMPAYRQLINSNLNSTVQKIQAAYPKYDWLTLYQNTRNTISGYTGNLTGSMPAFFTNVLGVIASGVIVPFVTFFLLKDGTEIKKRLIGLIPNRYFEMVLTLFYKVNRQISMYLRGTLLDCFIIGVMYCIGYSIIQVKYSIFLGLLSGVANLVPYMGPWLAAAGPFMIMFFDHGSKYPWWSVLVVVAIVQFVENNFIYPVVLGKSVSLHPLIIMFGLFVGGEVGGLVGMILAVPLIAVVKVVSEVLYDGLKRFSLI